MIHCGTDRGYRVHLAAREPACSECRKAHSVRSAENRRRRRERERQAKADIAWQALELARHHRYVRCRLLFFLAQLADGASPVDSGRCIGLSGPQSLQLAKRYGWPQLEALDHMITTALGPEKEVS